MDLEDEVSVDFEILDRNMSDEQLHQMEASLEHAQENHELQEMLSAQGFYLAFHDCVVQGGVIVSKY